MTCAEPRPGQYVPIEHVTDPITQELADTGARSTMPPDSPPWIRRCCPGYDLQPNESLYEVLDGRHRIAEHIQRGETQVWCVVFG